MIAKNTTVAVNFMVLDLDGFPATGKASSISATISINGAQATSISDTVTEKGSGWYYFNHAFATAGNVFIEFSATGCTIMPWEDDVVEMASGSLTAQQVWEYSGGRTVTNTIPTTAQIALAVWSYEDDNNFYYPYRTIRGIEYGSNHSMYQPYGSGHDGTLADTVWGFDPSTLVTNTTAGYRLVAIQNDAATAAACPSTQDIAEEVWTTTLSGVSPTVNSTYQQMMAIPANVWTNSVRSLTTRTVTYQGTTSEIASSGDLQTIQNAMATYNDLVLLQQHGDSTWATASTTGLATGSDVSTAQAAIIAAMPDISGLSTFNPTTTAVNVSSTSISNIQSGLATSTDVSTAQTAIINAMPDVSGLSTFDPANDTVLIDSTQAATMVTATGFATPSDLAGLSTFDPANDTVLIDSTQAAGMATATGFATPSDLAGLSTFNPSTDRVLIDATQAAAMVTATGFATPSDITTAVTDIETHGDNNWTGGGQGGGGATAQQIWEYPTRTLSAATLPNNASLATAANVDAAVTALETYGQTNWVTATGFATPSDLTGLSTFDAANDTVTIDSTQAATMVTATGFATPSDITTAQASIEAAIANIDIDTSDLATSAEVAVLAELQKDLNAGVLNWTVTENALTIYNDNNTVRATYTLTRDGEGNITRIQPNS